jgi:hypothetical protein
MNPLKLFRAPYDSVRIQFNTKDPEELSMICDGCRWTERCGIIGDESVRWCRWWLHNAKR